LLSEISRFAPDLPQDEVISNDLARKMPYLQAIIKEGLRWFPPVTGMLYKQVPPEGDEWKGVKLPPGAQVSWCVVGVMRSKEFWGDDADEFRPERWLDVESEAKLKEMDARVGLVFGYGKWQCLGRDVALMELNKVFVEVSRGHDLV